MSVQHCDELNYFLEYVRLLLQKKPIEGLSVWSDRFTQYRQNGQYHQCSRLLQGIKSADMPPYGVAIVRYSEGWLYDRIGRWQEAIAAYKASLHIFQKENMPIDIELWGNIGSLYQDQGLLDDAEKVYLDALVVTEQRQNKRGRGLILNNLGGLYLLRHETEKSALCFDEAVHIFRDVGDQYNYAASQVNLGSVWRDQGRLQDALNSYLASLLVYQQLGDSQAVGFAMASIAFLYQFSQHTREARAMYQQALSQFDAVGDYVNMTKTLGNLALMEQEEGNLEQALTYFEQALAGYRDTGNRRGEAMLLVNLAHLHTLRGDREQAVALASQAQILSEAFDFKDQLTRLQQLPSQGTVNAVVADGNV